MNFLIPQTGEPLHYDSGSPRPMRAMNLANALVVRGHKVVLWSSSFYHQEKCQCVTGNDLVKVSGSPEIMLVASTRYQRNIGPVRLWDHAVLGRNLAKQLDAETTVPDVAFVGYRPIEAAVGITRWLAEVRSLISHYDVGLSHGPAVGKKLENCIEDLAAMPDLRKKLSANALKLFRERFPFETVYGGLVSHLEMLVRRQRGL